jgi:hypothetical protein
MQRPMHYISALQQSGGDLNQRDQSGESTRDANPHATDNVTVDVKLMDIMVHEILSDMRLGACAETITQTVQILNLGNGKKAALSITVTTDHESFM